MTVDKDTILKAEIEHVFGRRIVSSRDCIHLCDEIFNKTKFRLNPNTLRRYFGLVKSKYPPSRATLNILCTYCGFRSVDEVRAQHVPAENGTTGFIDTESLLHYFVTLFNEIPAGDDPDKIFYNLVKHTIQFLSRNVSAISKFQRLIVKTRNGKEFYFEQFVNIDNLNGFYGDGLRYYLAEKVSPEAQAFAHSLLVFRYWLTIENHKLELHAGKLAGYLPDVTARPAAVGLYYAALLFQANINGISPAQVISDAHRYHALAVPASPAYAFEMAISEALVLTGNNEEALHYTGYLLQQYEETKQVEEYFLQKNYLLHAIALYKTGDRKNAARMTRKIKPAQFHFLSKNHLMILHGLLISKIRKNMPGHNMEQVDSLIQQTGFMRMKALY